MKNRLGAGLWESKFILPQHKEAIRHARHEDKRCSRPELDEQYAEEIGRTLTEAHRTHTPLSLRMFDPFDDVRVIGVIERLDAQGHRFMVDGEWFRMADILNVERAP